MFNSDTSPFTSNISSWFLLESNVHGDIEDPSYYFNPENRNRLKYLDLLLLTQGWRDFTCKYGTIHFQPEHGFFISGKARKLLSDSPLKNSTVTVSLLGIGKPLIDIIPIGEDGRFVKDGIDFSGEARLIASITGENDEKKGMVVLDSTRYSPAPLTPMSLLNRGYGDRFKIGGDSLYTEKESIITRNFHKFIQYAEISTATRRKYVLSDTIALGEVKVVAKKIDWTESARSRSIHYMASLPDKEIVVTPDQEKSYSNAYELLTRNMILSNGILKSPRRLKSPLYLIDGNRATATQVQAIPLRLIERIDVVNDPGKTMGSRTLIKPDIPDSTGRIGTDMVYSDGTISIILKDIDDPSFSKHEHSSSSTRFPGFNEPRIFYSPRYGKNKQATYSPDLRTTLFWLPDIKVKQTP